MAKVFISYARPQSELATELAHHLSRAGMEPWLAVDELQPGQAIARAVQTAAESADAAVLLIGPGEPTSWVRHEWSVVLDAHWRAGVRRLVAVLLDDAASLGFLREALVIRSSSKRHEWEQLAHQVTDALRRDIGPTDSRLASSGELRARLDEISREVQSLQPPDDDLERRAFELRNLLSHADVTAPEDRVRLLTQLAALNMQLGRHAATEDLLREAADLLAEHRPSETAAFVLYNLGTAVLARGDMQEALTILRSAYDECQATVGFDHVLTAAAAYNLGWTLTQLRKQEEARPYFETAVEVGSRTLGQHHDTVRTYSKALAGLDR